MPSRIRDYLRDLIGVKAEKVEVAPPIVPTIHALKETDKPYLLIDVATDWDNTILRQLLEESAQFYKVAYGDMVKANVHSLEMIKFDCGVLLSHIPDVDGEGVSVVGGVIELTHALSTKSITGALLIISDNLEWDNLVPLTTSLGVDYSRLSLPEKD